MDFETIVATVSTVGFPIVCCVVLFNQNNRMRDVIEENTKSIISLTDYIKLKDKGGKDT